MCHPLSDLHLLLLLLLQIKHAGDAQGPAFSTDYSHIFVVRVKFYVTTMRELVWIELNSKDMGNGYISFTNII